MSMPIYIWDTTYPDITVIPESLEQASELMDTLEQHTASEDTQRKYHILANVLLKAAESDYFSENFEMDYEDINVRMEEQETQAVISLEPIEDDDAYGLLVHTCQKLQLVIYDYRGFVLLPDGKVLPEAMQESFSELVNFDPSSIPEPEALPETNEHGLFTDEAKFTEQLTQIATEFFSQYGLTQTHEPITEPTKGITSLYFTQTKGAIVQEFVVNILEMNEDGYYDISVKGYFYFPQFGKLVSEVYKATSHEDERGLINFRTMKFCPLVSPKHFSEGIIELPIYEFLKGWTPESVIINKLAEASSYQGIFVVALLKLTGHPEFEQKVTEYTEINQQLLKDDPDNHYHIDRAAHWDDFVTLLRDTKPIF